MSTPTIDLNVKNYITAVRAELDDLEPDVRDDLLEDLEEHLHEVAAEGEGSLEERVGPPSDYAAELRASAGLPERGARIGFVRRTRERVKGSTFVRTIAAFPGMQRIARFARELQPGWWLLRAYLFVVAADILWTNGSVTQLPLPTFAGNWPLGIVAVLVLGILSIELGRVSSLHRWARRFAFVASVLVVVMTIAAGAKVHSGALPGLAHPEEGYVVDPNLTQPDGSTISNICPYSADGQPLSDVMLFDQDGRPISNVADQSDLPFRRIGNVFPREQQIADPQTSEMKPFECPTLRRLVPVTPAPSVSPAAAATPLPTEAPVP